MWLWDIHPTWAAETRRWQGKPTGGAIKRIDISSASVRIPKKRRRFHQIFFPNTIMRVGDIHSAYAAIIRRRQKHPASMTLLLWKIRSTAMFYRFGWALMWLWDIHPAWAAEIWNGEQLPTNMTSLWEFRRTSVKSTRKQKPIILYLGCHWFALQ